MMFFITSFITSLPSWWRKWWLGVVIVLLTVGLRGWQLGQVPHGLTWDEAAIGYNGFAIITTRRDEWLFKLPVSFRSFGDYKAPLAIYVNGIFTTLLGLGLEPWAIRLPFMLSGVAAVIGMMLLTYGVVDWFGLKNEGLRRRVSLLTAVWLAISPWHIHFTRTGFESGLTVTWIIWAAWFWLKALQSKSQRQIWWLLSALTWAASLYTYHSAKITVPGLLLVLTIVSWQAIWQQRQKVLVAAGVAAVSLLPLVWNLVFGAGLTRASSLIFNHVTSNSELVVALLHNFLVHFSLGFWVEGATTTLRHSDGHFGIVYWLDLLALGLVLVGFGWRRWRHQVLSWWDKWVLAGLTWTFLGLLPAILGDEVPHPNRALLAIVGVDWLVLAGWQRGLEWVKTKGQKLSGRAIGAIVVGYVIFLALYQWSYYTVFARESAEAFMDGYLEAAQFAVTHERDPIQGPTLDKILFTNHYGQPYVFVLLARKTNPIWYQGGALVKYEFANTITVGDLDRPNTLIVASAADSIPIEQADQLIYGSDGKVRFKLYLPKPPRTQP